MKFEPDLLRELLLHVEKVALRPYVDIGEIALEGWSEDEITYQIVLADEDGLISATIDHLPGDDDPENLYVAYSIHRLTSRGHELLGLIRKNEVWTAVKSGADQVGTMNVHTIMEFGQALTRAGVSSIVEVASAPPVKC